MRLGILGGTFDPVHAGHIFVAEEARIRLQLDKVLFIPAGNPWLKVSRTITPAAHRIEMVRLAIAKHEHFELSTMEVERGGPSYTVDTLEELRKQPECRDLYLLLGLDSFVELPQWKDAERIVALCTLVVVPRYGDNLPELGEVAQKVNGVSERNVLVLDSPMIGISSSGIRERIARGLPVDYLVPGAVERYIIAHGLYRGS
ncbi:MAG: nicotinate-nucleotide adenylyltransferase [Dehalococcoidia bacterium]|nr:nicotinate-nucleotide adenylyltransferase [Dehalococcoidia bacterium]